MQRRPIPLLVLASRGGSDAPIEAADAVAPADPGGSRARHALQLVLRDFQQLAIARGGLVSDDPRHCQVQHRGDID